MFSKSRTRHSSSNSTRSSLKHTTNNDSLVTLTKDPSSVITIPIPSPTNSNIHFPSTTQTTTQSMINLTFMKFSILYSFRNYK
jgi:hypothetical protein